MDVGANLAPTWEPKPKQNGAQVGPKVEPIGGLVFEASFGRMLGTFLMVLLTIAEATILL